MYEEIIKVVGQAIVNKDWSTFKRYINEDFTYKLVSAGMTFSYDEFFTLAESTKILNPEEQSNIIKVIEINEYVIFIFKLTNVENGKIINLQITHDIMKMDGNKIKSIVGYNSHIPDFKFIDKWLNTLNLEYERQSI